MTTLIAAAIGGLEALRPTIGTQRGSQVGDLSVWLAEIHPDQSASWWTPQQARRIVLAAALSLSAVGGLWIVVRPGADWFRLAAVAAAIPILAGYLTNLSGETGERTMVAVNLGLGLAMVAALTSLSVLPLRLLDYRLQRKALQVNSIKPQHADRSRLMSRAAVLSTVVLLLGLPVAIQPLVRRYQSYLNPPQAAFARWISPPPPNLWMDFASRFLMGFESASNSRSCNSSGSWMRPIRWLNSCPKLCRWR